MNTFKLHALAGLLLISASAASAQVVITTSGTYSQHFDTLPLTGSITWVNNSTLTGWFAQRSGTGMTLVADTGSSNGGNLYSYGSASASDRALGSIGSGNAAAGNFAYGLEFRNDTGATVTFNDFAFIGEQWRNSAAVAQVVAFSYKVSTTAITDLTPSSNSGWASLSALDFTSPITGGTAAALNGNTAANRSSLSNNVSLTLSAGEYIMFRWSDPDHTGSDHGLAIDNISVSYSAVPEPSTYAAIFGGLALMGAVIRRRRKAAKQD